MPERIQKQFEFINSNKLDGCSARSNIIGHRRVIPGLSYFFPIKLIMKYKNPFIHGTLFIKKSVLSNLGGYDERFYYAQDYHLYKKLIMSKYRIIKVREILYILNTENNISNSFKDEQDVYASIVKSRDENI